MSINWVEVTHVNTPLPIDGERFLPPSRVGQLGSAKLKLSRPVPSSEGSQQTTVEMTAPGTAFLSDMRIVFISDPSTRATNGFKSFSVQYQFILGTKYEQPWWGGNYISFSIIPAPEGGLTGGAGAIVKCELRVDGGGLYDFCSAFQGAMERARIKKLEENTLPLYTSSTAPPANLALTSGNSAPDDLPPAYTI